MDGNPKRQAQRVELHRVMENYHIDPRTAKGTRITAAARVHIVGPKSCSGYFDGIF